MKKAYKNIKKKTALEFKIFNITCRLSTHVGALNPSSMSITKSQCPPTQEKEEDKGTEQVSQFSSESISPCHTLIFTIMKRGCYWLASEQSGT